VTTCYKLQHGAVPEHGLVLAAAQDEPRLPRPCGTATLDAPAAAHPQVAAQNEAPVEVEEEVLPHRFHALEPPYVEPLRQPLDRGPRMRRLDLHALADENLQPTGRPVQRIPFGHAGKPTIEP